MLRILVVDDHPIVRSGLVAAISPEPDMEIAATAQNGREGVELYREHQPDVVLMDLKMPEVGGVEAITAIRAEFPLAKIVVLSTYEGDEDIYRALQAGAVTYLLKNTGSEKMIEVIRNVAAGGRPVPSEVAQKLADRMFQPVLTARELDVLRLVARGMRNKEIAAALGITEETIQSHVKSILAKFSVHDRTEAVVVGFRRGIVHFD
jgi:two-component system, NarL family, response regulator